MEHWVIITGGAFGGLALTFAVFYFCFDSLFQKLNTNHTKQGGPTSYVPQRYSKGYRKLRPDLERFVHEEFESPSHDVVALVMSTRQKCAGIAVFLQERKVEYFVESFPACCIEDIDSLDEANVSKVRAGLAAAAYWGVKCTMASNVTLLVDDRKFVEEANSEGSFVAEKLSQYENQYDFKIVCQWTDNFLCDTSANEELWEGIILSGNRLLKGSLDVDDAWEDFPCEEWERSRVRVNGDHFHQLPHAGSVAEDDESEEERLVAKKPLIDLS